MRMRLLFCFALFAQSMSALVDVDRVLNHINTYRKIHHAPPLTYSPVISEFSQSWADNMALSEVFQHSIDSVYGENIAMTSETGTFAIIQSIDMFYNEVESYDFSKPGFYPKTGHFTQLVWIKTTEIGFGVSVSSNGYTYVCTNYDPPGNYFGEFEKNVWPSSITSPSIVIAQFHPPLSLPRPTSSSPLLLRLAPTPPGNYFDETEKYVLPSITSPSIGIAKEPSPSPSPNPLSPYPHPPLLPPPPSPPSPRLPFHPPLPLSLPRQTSSYPVQSLNAPRDLYQSPSPSPSPCYISPRYYLSIKYPSNNKTHVETVLCPLIETMFNERCRVQLISSSGIYYGTNPCIDLKLLRQMVSRDIDAFTDQNKLLCGSTIAVYLNGDDAFRYLASRTTCL